MIDLRSDTVTRPCKKMIAAMSCAQVGDDVFDDDPSVQKLEKYGAELFGLERALFCPSGTMTNQIALFLQAGPLKEILLEESCHINNYEVGGPSFHSRSHVRPIVGVAGKLAPDQITCRVSDDHFPETSLLCIENSTNRGGGRTYDQKELLAISERAKSLGLRIHMDGARFFNAHAIHQYDLELIGKAFDSISICLSKGLGAPIGSLLLGQKDFIAKARKVRKVMGGGMRQAGFVASAGLFALENNCQRLNEDHAHARILANALEELPYVDSILPLETNILIFELVEEVDARYFLKHLDDNGLKAVAVGPRAIRFVTHLDISREKVEQACNILKCYNQ